MNGVCSYRVFDVFKLTQNNISSTYQRQINIFL
jgi:hypothetical protein